MARRFHHGVTDSTNERAFAALADGNARHLDRHVASEQTAGRGRLGRSWVSESGKGLYVSFVLLPAVAPPPAALSAAGALAVLDTVEDLGLLAAGLKWPNDVLVGRAKLAGVLAESRGLDRAAPAYVLGVGLNVAQESFPAELLEERQVTSLVQQGLAVEVSEVEEVLSRRIAERIQQTAGDLGGLSKGFLDATGLSGCEVEASTGAGTTVGVLLDLSLSEGIRLMTDSGEVSLPLEHLQGLRRS